MTTDPLTDAAYAESRQQWPMRDQRSAFESGARWAQRYLAAQEPNDAEVEAAARTWAESGPTAAVWEQMAEERREYTRERMHACLSAARAARRDEERRDG